MGGDDNYSQEKIKFGNRVTEWGWRGGKRRALKSTLRISAGGEHQDPSKIPLAGGRQRPVLPSPATLSLDPAWASFLPPIKWGFELGLYVPRPGLPNPQAWDQYQSMAC